MPPGFWGEYVVWVACIILAFVAFVVALYGMERRDKRDQKSVPEVRNDMAVSGSEFRLAVSRMRRKAPGKAQSARRRA